MTNIASLGQLIKDGRLDEARLAMKEAISAPLSDAERGRALVSMAMIYIEMKNKINKEFLADMKKIIESLKSVNKAELQLGDKVKLAEVRETLKQ